MSFSTKTDANGNYDSFANAGWIDPQYRHTITKVMDMAPTSPAKYGLFPEIKTVWTTYPVCPMPINRKESQSRGR